MRQELLAWYDKNRRAMPWRDEVSAYRTWVSEVMLQQTQVVTVIPFFERWMARFPSVAALAEADEQEVLSLWQGLGYYRRARSLLSGAKFIHENGLPKNLAEWLKVPGVGRYTAGAICSIALQQSEALVDGNVERVFSRLTANDSSDAELSRQAWVWAEQNITGERPGDWNQALMELGATVCKPKEPNCQECPVSTFCKAFRQGTPTGYPTPKQKRIVKELTDYVWVPISRGRAGIEQIPSGQWWEGMWQFPRASSSSQLEERFGNQWLTSLISFRHQVTHHRIQVVASIIHLDLPEKSLVWVSFEELAQRAMPAPQRKIAKAMLHTVKPESPLNPS